MSKTLKELAQEYKSEADKIKNQIQRLKTLRNKFPYQSARASELTKRIVVLEDMLRDTMIIANGLEHYYDTETKNSLEGVHTYEEELNNEQTIN